MQVEIQDAGPSRKRLQITVPPDRVSSHVDKMVKAAAQQVRMKGFRPGKVPLDVVRKQLGETILAEAKQDLIQETFREAIRTHKLEVLGQAKLDVTEGPLVADAELSYSVECDLKPQVKVGDARSIEIQRQSVEVTPEEVNEAIEQAALSKRKLQVVAEPMQAGDFAKADMVYVLDNAEIVRKQGMQVNASIPVRGCDPEVFRAKLLGQSAGETVSVPVRFPDNFEKEEARGKDGEVRLELHEVRRFVAPAIDDELAKGLEFESLEAMRKQVEERIADYKRRADEARIVREALDHLYTDHPFDLPEGLVAEETQGRLENMKKEMQQGKVSEADIEARLAEQREQVQEAARHDVRNVFLMEALALKEKLFVTESDVDGELRRIAAANDVPLAAARKHFEENKLFGQLRLELMQRKVRDFLKQTIKLVDSRPAKA